MRPVVLRPFWISLTCVFTLLTSCSTEPDPLAQQQLGYDQIAQAEAAIAAGQTQLQDGLEKLQALQNLHDSLDATVQQLEQHAENIAVVNQSIALAHEQIKEGRIALQAGVQTVQRAQIRLMEIGIHDSLE